MRYPMTEWFMSPVEVDITLYFNSDFNRFVTEDGLIIHDMHELLDPWQIEHAKKIGRTDAYYIGTSRDGRIIEIFFPTDWYEMIDFEYSDAYYNYYLNMDKER